MFALNAPTMPVDQSFAFGPKWRRVRRFLKPSVLVLGTGLPFAASFYVHSSFMRRPPLYGVYDVETFVRNGKVVPPLATDETRWRRLTFSRPGAMSIQLMTDRLWPLAAVVDSARHHVTGSERGAAAYAVTVDYTVFSGDSMRARGTMHGDSIDVMLRRLDERKLFRLLAR